MPGAELREVEGDEYRGVVKVKVGPITASYKGAARFEELDAAAHKAVLKAEGRETRGQGNATALITATLAPSTKGTKVVVATDLAITGKVAQFGRGVLADVSGKLLDQFVNNLETTVLASPAQSQPKAGADGNGGAVVTDAAAADTNGSAPESAPSADSTSSSPARKSRAKAATTAGAETGTSTEPEPETAADGDASIETASAAETAATSSPASGQATVRQIYSPPAEPVDLVDVAGGSLMKRLGPYLTVAGILLIARIVVYSLRRRRR
jgi:carbon monoxide dehydrogenase subunit G